MKLFGLKLGRDDARPALSRVGSSGVRLGGGEWPASYESQVRSGYERNPVAQRAVKLVMQAVAEAPLLACDPVAAALVGARSGGQQLLASVAAHLLLHGSRRTGSTASGWRRGRSECRSCPTATRCAAATSTGR